MIRVRFTLLRENPVKNGYYPDWVGPDKPEYNGARLVLADPDAWANRGEEVEAILLPMAPEYWKSLKPGSTLECRKGLRTTGNAEVVSIED